MPSENSPPSSAYLEAEAAGFNRPLPASPVPVTPPSADPSIPDQAKDVILRIMNDDTVPAETRRKAAMDIRAIEGADSEKPKIRYEMTKEQRDFLSLLFTELGVILEHPIPGNTRIAGTGTLGASRPQLE